MAQYSLGTPVQNLIEHSLWFQVNFLEDSLRTEDHDKGETSAKYKGARKPLTTFKGHLLHVRWVVTLTPPPSYEPQIEHIR